MILEYLNIKKKHLHFGNFSWLSGEFAVWYHFVCSTISPLKKWCRPLLGTLLAGFLVQCSCLGRCPGRQKGLATLNLGSFIQAPHEIIPAQLFSGFNLGGWNSSPRRLLPSIQWCFRSQASVIPVIQFTPFAFCMEDEKRNGLTP